jgi:hypothetical protein
MPSPDPGVVAPNWGLVMLDKSRTETEPGLGDPKARNSNPIQIVKKAQRCLFGTALCPKCHLLGSAFGSGRWRDKRKPDMGSSDPGILANCSRLRVRHRDQPGGPQHTRAEPRGEGSQIVWPRPGPNHKRTGSIWFEFSSFSLPWSPAVL